MIVLCRLQEKCEPRYDAGYDEDGYAYNNPCRATAMIPEVDRYQLN